MDKIPLVDLKREHEQIKNETLPAITKVVEDASFIKGKVLVEFETAFAAYSGTKYCIGLKSGTAALYIAQKALGIAGEIITVPNTFIATTETITQAGNSIRFVDIDENTYLMDLDQLNEAITKKTRAIIPVHLYGQMVDVAAIKEMIGSRDIRIIEDACQAHGALFNNKPPGTHSDCACYSFYPGKNLGAYGDAGALVTNDIKLADITNKLRDHGRGQKDKYEHRIEGYNERLDALQAAVLKVKLNYLPEWIKNRKAVAALYDKLLKGKVMTPYADKRADHAYHLYVVGVGKNRDQLLANLQAKGIGAGIHYPLPLHQQEAYAYMNLKDGSFPTTEGASKNILSLPINPHLTNEEINYISQVLSDSI